MNSRPYDVHAHARQIVAQSSRPMDLAEAYSILARRAAARRRSFGQIPSKRSVEEHVATIETPRGRDSWTNIPQPAREIRLPYRDN